MFTSRKNNGGYVHSVNMVEPHKALDSLHETEHNKKDGEDTKEIFLFKCSNALLKMSIN
jgi:hypothetical protein